MLFEAGTYSARSARFKGHCQASMSHMGDRALQQSPRVYIRRPLRGVRKSWPQDLLPLRAKEWRHILYGLDQSGGHARGYGWRFGGTEFPRSWTEKDVLQAAETLLREHGVIEDISRASIEGRVNGVLIRVAYRNDAKIRRIKTITALKE